MAFRPKAQANGDWFFGNKVDISMARVAVAEVMLIGGVFLGVGLAVTFEFSPSDWIGIAYMSGLMLFVHLFLLWPAYRRARARMASRALP